MARFAVGLVFGVVVGVVGGAALGIHAASESSAPAEVDTEAPETPVATPEPSYGVWDRLADCESGGDWHSASNRVYKGGLQFDSPTWARYGGLEYAWRADFATRAEQIAVARRTLTVQGWRAWPVCSRVVGLR
jgi:hypothetical protein